MRGSTCHQRRRRRSGPRLRTRRWRRRSRRTFGRTTRLRHIVSRSSPATHGARAAPGAARAVARPAPSPEPRSELRTRRATPRESARRASPHRRHAAQRRRRASCAEVRQTGGSARACPPSRCCGLHRAALAGRAGSTAPPQSLRHRRYRSQALRDRGTAPVPCSRTSRRPCCRLRRCRSRRAHCRSRSAPDGHSRHAA